LELRQYILVMGKFIVYNGELMVEINSEKIDKNLLEEEIENIIDRYKKNPLKRKKRKKIERKIYQIEDFTKYHDIEFIENLYRKVLLREVDQNALKKRLELLRSGKRSKSEILSMVRFSKEGRDKNIPILGIKKRLFITVLNRIPILSFCIKLFMLPKFIERVNRFEAHFFLYQQELNSKIEENKDSLNSKIEENKNSLNSKIEENKNSLNSKIEENKNSLNSKIEENKNSLNSKIEENKNSLNSKIEDYNNKTIYSLKELELRINEIKRAKEQLKEMENSLSNLVQNIKSNSSNQNILETIKKEQNSTLDELYISFEDKFRGKREDIKSRQAYYLPIVKELIKEPNDLVIDIGCGRGEWLELLKEHNIKSRGIDLNRLMVKESKELGLDVIESDAIEYLKSLEDSSISIVTGFHIAEHLPFKTLISLFDEVYRVLKIGGAIILETPNPENLFVGACSFYTDPTHINPIPPVTLEFLAQNRGFKNVAIHRLHPIKEPQFLNIENSQDVNNLIFASIKEQDYSIIGYK